MEKIKKFLTGNFYSIISSILVLILFIPAFGNFFSYDDFFHLKISSAESLGDFINFFNLANAPEGWGFYRPLSTQVFYYIGTQFLNTDPESMRVVVFLVFVALLFAVNRFLVLITGERTIAGVATVLYGLSASHFAHIYFLGAFQEVLMSFFVITSAYFFLKQRKSRSLFLMILGLMSKETAIVTPLLIIASFWYLIHRKNKRVNAPELLRSLSSHFAVLAGYLFLRFSYFGFATGDSYVWDISTRIFNTLFWYVLWSFNLPETLVDFVGSGLKINPNLFLYWGPEFKVIFTLFTLLTVGLLVNLLLSLRGKKLKYELLIFSGIFFIIGLGPVIFLPIHKFPYYLTLSAIGFSLSLSEILHRRKIQTVIFIIIFGLLDFFTLKHTANTHWVTRGGEVAQRVYNYASENRNDLKGKSISFYDLKEDESYPFSPTETVNLSVSGQDFFDFYFKQFGLPPPFAVFGYDHKAEIKLESRNFTKYE